MVENNENLIVSTNYWNSGLSRGGIYFFSVNAGCVRMLMPTTEPAGDKLDDSVFETTQYVIISRGIYMGLDAYEVLFEDGSSNPFAIHAAASQWDRLIPAAESGRTDLAFQVYRNGKMIRHFACKYRFVPSLPFMKEWK